MYLLAILLVGTLFSNFAYLQNKTIIHPVIIFNMWWIFCTVVGTINPYHLFEISDEVYSYIFWGMMAFDLACFFVTFVTENKKKDKKKKNDFSYKSDYDEFSIKRLLFIQAVIIAIILPYAYKAIRIFISGGWNGIRISSSSSVLIDNVFSSTFEVMIYRNLIVIPIAYATIILCFIFFALGKMKFIHLIPTLIIITFQVFISSGRIIVFRSIIFMTFSFFAVGFISSKRDFNFFIKYKKRIKYILIAFIGAIMFGISITSARSLSSDNNIVLNFIKNTVIYLTGSLSCLSLALTHPQSFGVSDTIFHGQVFFGGIVDSYNTFLSYFLHQHPIPVYTVNNYTNIYHYISPDIQMNGFTTIYYYFIRDFGKIGAIFEMSLFGLVVSSVYAWFLKKRSVLSISIYLVIIYIMISSILWWELLRLEFWYCFIHLIWITLFLKKRNISMINSQEKKVSI